MMSITIARKTNQLQTQSTNGQNSQPGTYIARSTNPGQAQKQSERFKTFEKPRHSREAKARGG